MATITIHVAPSQRTSCLVFASVSVACAMLKWHLATVKSGPRAVVAALQQQGDLKEAPTLRGLTEYDIVYITTTSFGVWAR